VPLKATEIVALMKEELESIQLKGHEYKEQAESWAGDKEMKRFLKGMEINYIDRAHVLIRLLEKIEEQGGVTDEA
jgi:predicted Ser/Thr protein kinase